MSPSRVSNTRKRRNEYDSSDSETDDVRPPLKVKKCNGNPNVPLGIRTHLVKIVGWISKLPLKEYFQSAIKMASEIPEDTVTVDDDDEITVIDEKRVGRKNMRRTNPFVNRSIKQNNSLDVANYKISSLQPSGRCKPVENSTQYCFSPSTTFGGPFASSTPNSFIQNMASLKENNLHNQPRNFFSRKLTNGTVSADRKNSQITQANHGALSDWKHKSNGTKQSAPITNPDTDIEILYDFCNKSTKEPHEIEILSEIPNSTLCMVPHKKSQPPPPPPTRVFHSLNRDSAPASESDSSSRRQQSLVTSCSSRNFLSYTAHTVVRLQEREQYRWLLEHWIHNGSHYRSVPKKLQSQEVEVDLTDKPIVGNHFQKEVLKQPLDKFLEKYYKPCRMVTPITSNSGVEQKETNEPEITEENDDEVQILEVRLPQYVPKYRQNVEIFSSEWIQELKTAVHAETEERLAIVQEQERELERYRKERLRDKLKLKNAVCEREAKEVVLPVITAEMEAVIENALQPTCPNDRLCSLNGQFHILRKDIETLSGLNWLNDEVINYYLALIVQRSKDKSNMPSVYAFNSFFYPSLKSKGYSAVRRWTRKVDIFAHDLNLVPLHLGVHWCLAVIDHRSKKIQYFDSMGNGEDQCVDVLREYLIDERKDKKSEVMDPNSYITETVKDIPQQMNGSDCGMFTLKYAEYITRDAEITFTQKEMQYFRKRMVYEFLTNKVCE